jgi:hypothetical protein
MIKELRLAFFVWLLGLIINLVPKDAQETWKWLAKMPWEEL